MSVRLSRSGCTLALALFGAAAVMVCVAGAEESKSAAPAASPAVTAVPSQPGAKPDALKQLEDDLRHALESLSPRSAPESTLAPQVRPPVVVVPNQRAKDAEERRKNWLLPDSDTLPSGTSRRDWLNPSDNPLDTKARGKNSLDNFYERLNQGTSSRLMPRATDSDPLGLPQSSKTTEPTARDDANLPSGIRDSARRLQDLLGGFNRTSERSAATDSGSSSSFFGRVDKGPSAEDLKAHKAYMDEYSKVLNGPTRSPATALTPLVPLSPGSTPPGAGIGGGLDTLGSSSRSKTFDSLPGMVTTIRSPTTLPDPNAGVLNQWNALYAPPKLDPPKPAPLAVPQAEAPHRRF